MIASVFIACLSLGSLQSAWAQTQQAVGEVEQSRGVGFVQSPGQGMRSLSKGTQLQEGDRLSTAADSLAIVKLSDGTKMTIRPNSEMVLSQFKYVQNASDNAFVLNLLRGGLRAVTGLINKSSPNAARIQTNTATIGIRGTDFDARICQGGECRSQATPSGERKPMQINASARLHRPQGQIQILDDSGQRRNAVEGTALYPGEIIETGADGLAVLVFRDESKMTVGASTRFRLDSFVFDRAAPTEGNMAVTLLRGSLRAITGLIGKANNRNVRFSTSTATIGIRGTGVDLQCTGVCAGDPITGNPGNSGFLVFVFDGAITVTQTGQTESRILQVGQGLIITPSGVRTLDTQPPMPEPRPDRVTPPENYFNFSNIPDGQDGLFVHVRDGHIELISNGQVLQLGAGETGVQTNNGVGRPQFTPFIIILDNTPLPGARNISLLSLLPNTPSNAGGAQGGSAAPICRVL